MSNKINYRLRSFQKGLSRICLGHKPVDKLRLLVIAVLKYTGLSSSSLAEKLWRKTVCRVDGITYALVDSESFRIMYREYESFMQVWLKPKRGNCLLDIGAHIGRYTLASAKAVGSEGFVVSVEPHPVNYQILRRNIDLNGLKNVIAFNLAAWNKDGELKLFAGSASGHHSLTTDQKHGCVRVKSRAMDRLCEELRLNHVEWAKIDVEGAEWEVLRGLEETISKYRPKIITEVFYENIDRVKRFLKEHGYGFFRISPHTYNLYLFCIPLKEAQGE